MQSNDLFHPTEDALTDFAANPFVLTCGRFMPGEADRFLSNLSDPTQRTVCEAELLYYRGQPKQANALAAKLQDNDDTAALAGAFLIDAITSLATGRTERILDGMQLLTDAKPLIEAAPKTKKTIDFFLLYFNILAHNRSGMHFPDVGVDAFAVPDELMPFAIYAYAHYLNLCGDYGRAIGLAEGTLIQMKKRMPISETYLAIITSVGYICRGEWEKAEYYFRYAWEAAQPDGIFMPFVELRGMLSGMLERCIRYEQPEAYKQISLLFRSYHKNWVRAHNLLTGENVTDRLTGTELNVAMLAARGLTNTEIGEFLSVSVNSVRSHLRNIFNKLGISNRKALKEYVLN